MPPEKGAMRGLRGAFWTYFEIKRHNFVSLPTAVRCLRPVHRRRHAATLVNTRRPRRTQTASPGENLTAPEVA